MKKNSLTSFRKLFKMKSKEDDFSMLQKPSLASDFGQDDSLFGGCYTKDRDCDLHGEEVRAHKSQSKSESLIGTLKRRFSTKQKSKGKGGLTSVNDDTSFSSSVPMSFSEIKSQRPLRSSSLHSHHYSPSPWPTIPIDSEETCTQVKVKAMVHLPSPTLSFKESRKEFDVQMEGFFHEATDPVKNPESNGDFQNLEAHVPVIIPLTPQDYIQYTMPLDQGMYPSQSSVCIDRSSPMEHVIAESVNDPLLSSGLLFDESDDGILLTSPQLVLESSRSEVALFSPSLSSGEFPRTYSQFKGASLHLSESVRHHLDFDPDFVSRMFDSVEANGPKIVTSLTAELKKLARQGWYWGPITRWEAEDKLLDLPDGSFLVRDSSDDRYLLSLSFRSQSKTLHTRIEHSNGRFSFYEQPDMEGHMSIVDLIEYSIKDSENGAFCYSRSRQPGSVTYPVRLTNPVSRFMQVRSLQYLCRFVIRQYTRIDLIQKLPLPNKMKDYLEEKHY